MSSVKNELSLADCTFIFTLKDSVPVRKIHLNKAILQITSISAKGRHSNNAEVNAESFECGYFL